MKSVVIALCLSVVLAVGCCRCDKKCCQKTGCACQGDCQCCPCCPGHKK